MNNPVLMPCHNSFKLTKDAVTSILNQSVPVHLLVVDNDSEDETPIFMQAWGIQSYRVSPQIGVTRAWNYGLRYFFDNGAEHVLVTNNDVVLRPDTYRELLDDGGPFVTCVGVNSFEDSKKPFLKTIRPHPDFSCFLIRRLVWNQVGPFDERMVLYASDADYHVRMFQAGIAAYTIGLPFYHVACGTMKGNPERAQAICDQADRDREFFFRKWGCKVGTPEYYQLFR